MAKPYELIRVHYGIVTHSITEERKCEDCGNIYKSLPTVKEKDCPDCWQKKVQSRKEQIEKLPEGF